MINIKYLLVVINVLCFSVASAQTFQSQEEKVTLLELYTSQGCSSCPPAENWISKLKTKNLLWKKLVPLAFHVDYWDYLGWKDPYASKQHSQRQRDYYRQKKTTAIYTPGFLQNGTQWRYWRSSKPAQSRAKVGILSATLTGKSLVTRFSQFAPNQILNVAILGFGVKTAVHAGENKGKRLPQDFVVLHHQKIRAGKKMWKTTLPSYQKPEVKRYALAVWIQNDGDLAPIQATGGWLK